MTTGRSKRTVRVFLSSPSDVGYERGRAERVSERLSGMLDGVEIRCFRWEKGRYFSAHDTFQKQIPETPEFDLVVGILWSRLGMPPPEGFPEMRDGRRYPSGTAYELLTAIEHRHRQQEPPPDILVYRKTAEPPISAIDSEKRSAQNAQLDLLDSFLREWFFDKSAGFKAAFQSFETADDFEALFEANLRTWLEENHLLGRERRWRVEEQGPPFCGLEAFGARHREVFFGRRADTERARERFDEASRAGVGFLLIEGASGSGKSSLARASLLPRLQDLEPDRRVAIALPQAQGLTDPVQALAAAMFRETALPELAEGDFPDPAKLAEHLSAGGGPAPVLRALDRASAALQAAEDRAVAPEIEFVLLVDQLEQLFGRSVSADRRSAFAATLDSLARSGRVRVVTTLRANALGAALELPALAGLIDAGARLSLAAPGPEALSEIVRGPAEAAALAYERDADGRGLDEILIRDTSGAEALPLLQFALEQLYGSARDRLDQDGSRLGDVPEGAPVLTLTFADYEALGGLSGAIGRHAEQAVADLPGPVQGMLPRLIRALTEGSAGAPVLRAAGIAEAAPTPEARQLAEALVEARILVRNGDSLRIAHETALTAWPRAAQALEEAKTFLRVRAELERAEARWRLGGRRSDLLLPPGVRLAEAEAVLRDHRDELPEPLHVFVTASGRRARLRQRMTAAAAVVFAGVAGVAVWYFYEAQENARIADANAAMAEENAARAQTNAQRAEAEAARAEESARVAEAARGRAEREAEAKTAALEQVAAERDRAEQNFATAQTAIDALIFDIAQGLKDVEGMQLSALRRILGRAEDAVEQLLAGDPDNPDLLSSKSAMLDEFADVYAGAGDSAAALAAASEALEIARALVARDPENTGWRRDLSVSLRQIGDMRRPAGDAEGALAAYEEALEIDRALVVRDPDNNLWQHSLSVSLNRIGDMRRQAGEAKAALAAYEQTLGIYRALVERDPDNTLWQHSLSVSLDRIGGLRRAAGEAEGALAAYEEALAIRRDLVARDPENTQWQNHFSASLHRIGEMHRQSGDTEAALATYEEALAVNRALVARDPENTEWRRSVAVSLQKIGDMHRQGGDTEAALATYEEMLEIIRFLVARDPENIRWQYDLNASIGKIGDMRRLAGDAEAALAAYEEALGIDRALVERDPENTLWQRGLAVTLNRIGGLRRAAGEAEKALAAYEEALAIRRDLVARDPENLGWQRELFVSLEAIGDMRRLVGDGEAALAAYEEGLTIARNLLERDSKNIRWRYDFSLSLSQIGDMRRHAGDAEGALAAYEEALAIRRILVAHDPENTQWQNHFSVSLHRIGDMRRRAGDTEAALSTYEEALAVNRALVARDPENTEWRRNLSVSLDRIGEMRRQAGDAEAALAANEEALAIRRDLVVRDPENVQLLTDMVISLWNLSSIQEPDAAREGLSEALGILLRLEVVGQLPRDMDRGISEIKERLSTLGIDPRVQTILELLDAANASFETGNYAAAYDAQNRALTLWLAEADLVDTYSEFLPQTLSNFVYFAVLSGANVKAEEVARMVLENDPNDTITQGNLALALMYQDEVDAARDIFLRFRGEELSNGLVWEEAVRGDFDLLRAQGRPHPLMDEIEAAFEE